MRESHLAARVLDALLREDYGGLSSQVVRGRGGVGLTLADGRLVRLAPGAPFQDFVVAAGELLGLEQVLDTLAEIAPEEDADGVKAFFDECVAALAALELHDARPPGVRSYETLAALADHPCYPTARARPGVPDGELAAYAPEFGPVFELRWAAVPRRMLEPGSAPRLPPDVLASQGAGAFSRELLGPDEVLFPVHPLTVDEARRAGARVLDVRRGTVRPTASMRAVEAGPRTHLVLPLPISVLGTRDRLGIEPGSLSAAARAEPLLRALAGPDVLVAGEQEYARAGHEHLAWLVRRLPQGRRVPVAALTLPDTPDKPGTQDQPDTQHRRGPRARTSLSAEVELQGEVPDGAPEGVPDGMPGLVRGELQGGVRGGPGGVRGELQAELQGGVPGEVVDVPVAYVRALLRWSVRLLVEYGVVPEVRWHDAALVLVDGAMKVLVQGHDGVLVSPARLAAAGIVAPGLPERMLTDDPHALADAFVTGALHLGAAAVAFSVLPPADAAALLRRSLEEALRPYDAHPTARLLRARTLDAARLTGRPWLTAGTLASAKRLSTKPPRMSGPNYLRLR
ncbi:IucA/IucC family protein [Nonomuraea ferruginea]|uniref:Siderophore biosynthesis protein n=1 Tax=Nonomuraea ferruginea TaxID=46174 RepID=A0ABT4TAE3_9ACTN|nr:IucA/IucC family protein [Nonomuraea ferruginea]MDA0646493.1 siderophore biosynthesis protein [Nonomuraea ferruginea]